MLVLPVVMVLLLLVSKQTYNRMESVDLKNQAKVPSIQNWEK